MLIALEQSESNFEISVNSNTNSNHRDATQGSGQIIPQRNNWETLEYGGGQKCELEKSLMTSTPSPSVPLIEQNEQSLEITIRRSRTWKTESTAGD